MSGELRVLLSKEWRQLLRSKMAMFTALLLPIILMVAVPLIQLVAAENAPRDIQDLEQAKHLPPALAALANDPKAIVFVLFPLFVALAGLIVPSVTATYTVISERETRTLELLVALPVRVGQVLAAKILALVIFAGTLTAALLTIDAVVLLMRGVSLTFVLSLYLLLFCAIGFGAGSALLVSVLARDFRTANNINGAVFVPTIMVTAAVVMLMPSPTIASLVLSAVYLLGGAACVLVATGTTTFERLLR